MAGHTIKESSAASIRKSTPPPFPLSPPTNTTSDRHRDRLSHHPNPRLRNGRRELLRHHNLLSRVRPPRFRDLRTHYGGQRILDRKLHEDGSRHCVHAAC
jgi:hypothetical protein